MSAIQFWGRPHLEALTPTEVRALKSDAQLYRLTEGFLCYSPEHGDIAVPAGFVSDFASVPKPALWFADADAPEILFGSIVHDYLYSVAGCLPDRVLTRQECDEILRQCMRACGASWLRAWVVFQSVRIGGGLHWGRPAKDDAP